jgi:predicted transposase YbfD/YdcC
MAAAWKATGRIPIASDGKSARRARRNTATGRLHRVGAWATENQLTPGQVAVADGSNEAAAIPELLRTLELTGALVAIDAAGCQTENARLIREGGGHYLLAAKGNQPALEGAVRAAFDRACAAEFEGVRHDTHASVEDGHGRHAERYVTVPYHPAGIPAEWPDVAAVAPVGRERRVGDRTESTAHHYRTSYAGTAAEMAGFVRGHWGIENGLHRAPDVAFREDESRTRAGHAGANLGLLRRVAVRLLKRAGDKGGIETGRLRAGWDQEFLLRVLQGIPEV